MAPFLALALLGHIFPTPGQLEGWHLVRIEIRGRSIRASLDGEEILRFEDEGKGPERGGLIISSRRWSRSSEA